MGLGHKRTESATFGKQHIKISRYEDTTITKRRPPRPAVGGKFSEQNKICAKKHVAQRADDGSIAVRSPFFPSIQGSGEGRENRPQLRCGYASQTSTAR
jgi:hypothetical protein